MSFYPIILSQNQLVKHESLHFPIEERGLQFGDGVYEVIRIYHGQFYLLTEHIDRLFRSLKAIDLSIPYTKIDLKSNLQRLLKRNNMNKDGIVYLQITRGSAPRTHFFPEDILPNMYAYVQNIPRNIENLTEGVTAITLRDERWKNCYIKSLNLLPNVLAKQEAVENGCYEAIFYNDNDEITECSASNVFLVKDGKIFTHPATNAILNGCIRMTVKRIAKKLAIPFIEKAFTLSEINKADELFLTSSISEVLPIIKVDETIIGDGVPGKISKQLQNAYELDAKILTYDNQEI